MLARRAPGRGRRAPAGAASAAGRRRDPARRRALTYARARRALQPAGPGPARRGRRARVARRPPGPHRARGRGAAGRGRQDRGRRGAVELAPGDARADRHRGGRRRAGAARGAGVHATVAAEVAAGVAARLEVVAVGDDYEALARGRRSRDDPGGRGEAAATPCCRCTRRGRPACPRACSRRIATSRRRRSTSPLWALRRGHRQPDAAADVPHRRHRLDVPRALARAPRRSSSASSTPRRCSTCSKASA